jgi:hypothetical protein
MIMLVEGMPDALGKAFCGAYVRQQRASAACGRTQATRCWTQHLNAIDRNTVHVGIHIQPETVLLSLRFYHVFKNEMLSAQSGHVVPSFFFLVVYTT